METKELALNGAVSEALELVEELKQLKVNLALELEEFKDWRSKQEDTFEEFMANLYAELARIKADFRTEATILHLIKAGDGDGTKKTDRTQETHAQTRGAAPH